MPLTGLAERFDLVGDPPREEDDCEAIANSMMFEVEGKTEKSTECSTRPRGGLRGDERRALGIFSASEANGIVRSGRYWSSICRLGLQWATAFRWGGRR